MSKILYPPQARAFRFFYQRLNSGLATLDQSDMGTGKTPVGVKLAKALGRPVAVICPKAVIPAWERELAEEGITATFVLNLESLRRGKTGYVSKVGKKNFKWLLPQDTFFLVDEIHMCKGPWSQNAALLVALVKQGYLIHGMSGTSCEDPTEMRPLGLMLGLHSGDEKKDGMLRWWPWMRRYGCEKNNWGSWVLEDPFHLPKLRKEMYSTRVHRLTVSDFPTSFKENRVFVQPIQFRENKKIQKAYEDLGVTPSIVEEYIEKGTVTDSEHVLANITAARRLAEAFKVVDIAEMAEDLMQKGNSVVLFVNYSDTVDALRLRLKCDRIDGRQTATDRQRVIDEFQADQTHCIAVNAAAGGTGISLHDTVGNRPRVALISPTFNFKIYKQVLGRIHRNGGKSDAIQKVLVASDSIEEHVMRAIQRRQRNMKHLHNVE
tara:strand:+ start:3360 stop:4661 length:1302 start_codon:yes stop_codon:yes gene_type:complete